MFTPAHHRKLTIFIRFAPLDTIPKKYPNPGLRKNLKSTSKKAPEPIDPFLSGGLQDEDADETRPPYPAANRGHDVPPINRHPPNLQRNYSRQNNVCLFQFSNSPVWLTTTAT